MSDLLVIVGFKQIGTSNRNFEPCNEGWDSWPLGWHTRVIDIPMEHTRNREPLAQVVRRWVELREGLGSNPAGGHSLVWVPKSCWWDLMKVETAVLVSADLVSFTRWTMECVNSRSLVFHKYGWGFSSISIVGTEAYCLTGISRALYDNPQWFLLLNVRESVIGKSN